MKKLLIKVSRSSPQNSSETDERETEKVGLETPGERQRVVDIVMEYHKIEKLMDNTLNKPYKLRTKSWIDISDGSCGTNSTNSQINFKNSRLKWGLFDYSEAYILVEGTITIRQAT